VHQYSDTERCAVYDAERDGFEPVCASDEDVEELRTLVPEVLRADLADPAEPWRHDADHLLSVLREVTA